MEYASPVLLTTITQFPSSGTAMLQNRAVGMSPITFHSPDWGSYVYTTDCGLNTHPSQPPKASSFLPIVSQLARNSGVSASVSHTEVALVRSTLLDLVLVNCFLKLCVHNYS